MKKLLLFLIASAIMFVSCGTDKFTIKGNVQSFAGDTLYLSILSTSGNGFEQITKVPVQDSGDFEFTGSVEEPNLALIMVGDPDSDNVIDFFLENAEYSINQEGDLPYIDGGREYQLKSEFEESLEHIKNKEDYMKAVLGFMGRHNDTHFAGFMLAHMLVGSGDPELIMTGYDLLNSDIQNSKKAQYALEMADKLRKQPRFIDFAANTPDGKSVKLSDVAGKGKWVLLDFWASWCGPCRVENPNVVEAYEKFKDKGFTVFGYSLDNNKADWTAAIKKDKLGNWTNVSDLSGWQSPASQVYGIRSIPSNFLINPKGEIVAKNLKGAALINFLEQHL